MPVTADNGTLLSIEAIWSSGQPIVNTFFYHRLEHDPEGAAIDVLNNWQDEIVQSLPNNYTLQGCRYIDIESLDGVTGFIPANVAKPYVGTIVGAVAPPSCSILVHKNIAGVRNARAGRLYLPPGQESEMDEDGNVLPSKITSCNAIFADFHLGTDDSDEQGYTAVLHVRPGQPVTWSKITGYTTDPKIATQRRRLTR